MKETYKCIGCGIELQTEDENKLGYIKKEILDKYLLNNDNPTNKEILCQRCFKIKHYNDYSNYVISYKELTKIINKINKENNLVIYIIDVLNLDFSYLNKFINKDIVIILNKRDLLPKSINDNKLINYLKKEIKKQNTNNNKILEIIVNSNKKLDISKEILDKLLLKYKKYKNIYITGLANSGKSSLINNLISILYNKRNTITTSKISGTTIDLIKIPLNNYRFLIDTPGYLSKNNFVKYLNFKEQLKSIPDKTIKPKIYQLETSQSLIIDNFLILNYLEGTIKSFTLYFNNNLNIQRSKLENLSKHINFDNYQKFKKNIIELKEDKKYNIILNSLGIISFEGKGKIEILTFEEMEILINEPFI